MFSPQMRARSTLAIKIGSRKEDATRPFPGDRSRGEVCGSRIDYVQCDCGGDTISHPPGARIAVLTNSEGGK
jgi:hypothetical protein